MNTNPSNINQRIILLLLFPVILAGNSSCSSDEDPEEIEITHKYWTKASDFEGSLRSYASTFMIDNLGYLVGGYDGKKQFSDLWVYDMELDSWTQKADFPGTARNLAVAFAVDQKGYYGTGYDGTSYLNDFWEYNPERNTWLQLENFQGSARFESISFGANGKGYIGCGYDGNYLNDFYMFDPSTNKWSQIKNFTAEGRRGAVSFVINNIPYVFTGENNGVYATTFLKYDTSSGEWITLHNPINHLTIDPNDPDSTIFRSNGVAFVINDYAYLTCGEHGVLKSDTWKYDPEKDRWERVSDFEGEARTNAVAFSNGSKAFVLTGNTAVRYFDDMWEFNPKNDESNQEE